MLKEKKKTENYFTKVANYPNIITIDLFHSGSY